MKRKFNLTTPDTYIILFFVVIFFAALTYVIPVGKFMTKQVSFTNSSGQTITKSAVIPDSFKLIKNHANHEVYKPAPIFNAKGGTSGILNYMFEGLTSGNKWGAAIGVVIFILVIGGAIGIVIKTEAIETCIMKVIAKTRGKEFAIIPILFLIFSLGGMTFGMSEENIAFSVVIVPLIIALGYDGITAVLVSYIASQVGYATSPLNPFCVLIAQGIAGVHLLSGSALRWVAWVFFTTVGIIFTMLYARKIKKDPTKSLSYKSDGYFRNDLNKSTKLNVKFSRAHLLVIATIFGSLTWIIWGVLYANYYIPQIATIFFIMGLVAGIIGVIFKLNKMTINDIASSFRSGASDLVGAALIVGMAKGIILVLGGSDPTKPTIMNTLLHYSSNSLRHVPTMLSAWFMYILQIIIKFIVPSTSGQAALTMPLMAPLAVIIGLSKQMAVFVYQMACFASGIFPTDPSLIGVLAVARISWVNWARAQIRFQLLLGFLATLFIIGAVLMHY